MKGMEPMWSAPKNGPVFTTPPVGVGSSPMSRDRIEIVERIECIERVERVERIVRLERVERRARVGASAAVDARTAGDAVGRSTRLIGRAERDVVDVEARDVSAAPREPVRTAPRGLVLNGVWVPLAP